jgi:hypothetical protein
MTTRPDPRPPGNYVYILGNLVYDEGMAQSINDQPICFSCGGPPDPTNFGGLCDPCTERRKVRLVSAALTLDAYGQAGANAAAVRHVARRYGYTG